MKSQKIDAEEIMMKSHIIKIPPIFFPTVYLKLVHILKTHHIYKPFSVSVMTMNSQIVHK